MAKISAYYLQHRHTIGHFNQSQNKKQNAPTQQQIRQWARYPGLHSGNIQKQHNAQVLVQAIAMLSSVRNIDRIADVIENRNKMGINQYEVENARKTLSTVNLIQNRHIGSTNRALQTQNQGIFFSTPVTTKITHTSFGLSTFLDPMTTVWHEVDRLLSKYDPLKFPGAEAKETESQVRESYSFPRRIRHKHRVLTVTRQANRNIIHYLRKHSNLKQLSLQKEILVSAVAAHLFDSDLNNWKKELKNIARHILAAQNLYGGNKEEIFSLKQAESVFRYWVFDNLLGVSPAEYIVRRIAIDPNPSYFTVDSLHYLFSLQTLHKDGRLNVNRIPKGYWGHFNAMWFSCFNQEIPLLKFDSRKVKEFSLTHYNFAALYAGSRFLDEANCRTYSMEEAIQFGQKMWDVAINEGITVDKIKYFELPSLIFIAQQTPDRINQERNIQDVNLIAMDTCMQYRRMVEALHQDIIQKYDIYQSAVQEWMSKETLVEEIISQESIEVLYNWVPQLRDIPDKEEQKVYILSQLKRKYLNDQIRFSAKTLSEIYQKRTENVSNSFYELDKYLIHSALNLLPREEYHFISSPSAMLYPVSFEMKGDAPSQFVVTPSNLFYVHLERTDLFSVILGQEERIYALKGGSDNHDEFYQLIRVDRNLKRYIQADLFDYKKFRENDRIEQGRIISRGGEFKFSIFTDKKQNICKGGEENSLIAFLSNIHRKKLYESLYRLGDYESTSQKIWNVVKGIIPFYDCVEGIVNHDPVQAVPSCLLDAFAFIPVVGQAASLSQKFGISLAKGMAKGSIVLSKNSLSMVATTILREVSLPMAAELISLGKTTLRSLDPGIEFLTGASKKFGDKIIIRLLSDKKTRELARSIQSLNVIDKLPHKSSTLFKSAFLPHSKIKVPVKKIGNDGVHNIYTQMNPETGEAFGYRYKIDETNTLIRQERVKKIQSTSPRISKALRKCVTPEMYEKNINLHDLSYPDRYGLRWNAQQEAFLEVGGGYIKIKVLNDNRFLLGPTFYHYRTVLRFKRNRFFVESVRERLQNILKMGLSGGVRERKNPINVLTEVDGFNRESAEELLSQYQFPEQGLFSEYSFASDVEQTGSIPQWADRFKKVEGGQQQSKIFKKVVLMNPKSLQDKIPVKLGKEIGEGGYGKVFLDADDNNFVIKQFYLGSGIEHMIEEESQNFVRYYGPDSAKMFVDDKGNYYIRMYRLPGDSLYALPMGSLPVDAVERFVDMIEKMNNIGILHGDLHNENVFWDSKSQMFYPLDISNERDTYFSKNAYDKSAWDEINENLWDRLIEEIQLKMKKPITEEDGSRIK